MNLLFTDKPDKRVNIVTNYYATKKILITCPELREASYPALGSRAGKHLPLVTRSAAPGEASSIITMKKHQEEVKKEKTRGEMRRPVSDRSTHKFYDNN